MRLIKIKRKNIDKQIMDIEGIILLSWTHGRNLKKNIYIYDFLLPKKEAVFPNLSLLSSIHEKENHQSTNFPSFENWKIREQFPENGYF